MPRRLTLQTPEMGPLELYLIYNEDGIWEVQWREFQGVWPLPEISKADMDHALHGWTRPLVDQLGPPPKGMLRKLPTEARRCSVETRCPFFNAKHCGLLLPKMPWCFIPEGTAASHLATELINLWRSEVYVVVIKEPPLARTTAG